MTLSNLLTIAGLIIIVLISIIIIFVFIKRKNLPDIKKAKKRRRKEKRGIKMPSKNNKL